MIFNRGNIEIGVGIKELKQREIVHLARVDLRDHDEPRCHVSWRIAVKVLHDAKPGIRLIRAYSWLGAGHDGADLPGVELDAVIARRDSPRAYVLV